MKRLKDGDEDDVVGYQPEGYDDMTRITKRATNQSAFRNRCGCGWCWKRKLGWGLGCG